MNKKRKKKLIIDRVRGAGGHGCFRQHGLDRGLLVTLL